MRKKWQKNNFSKKEMLFFLVFWAQAGINNNSKKFFYYCLFLFTLFYFILTLPASGFCVIKLRASPAIFPFSFLLRSTRKNPNPNGLQSLTLWVKRLASGFFSPAKAGQAVFSQKLKNCVATQFFLTFLRLQASLTQINSEFRMKNYEL